MLELVLQTPVGWSLCVLALHGLGCSLQRWQRDPGMDGGMLESEVSPRGSLLPRGHGMSALWAAGGLPTPVPHAVPASAALGGICIKGLVTWLRAWTPVKCV